MKGTFEQLTGRYETVFASDSESKARLLSVFIVDGGCSTTFWVEGHGPNKEFGSLAAACREYDARVKAYSRSFLSEWEKVIKESK